MAGTVLAGLLIFIVAAGGWNSVEATNNQRQYTVYCNVVKILLYLQ